MEQSLIQRYQPGGDIFATLSARYGKNGATMIAIAAQSGDRYQVNDAIDRVKYGERLDESTFRLFWEQIASDPLGAPLDSLDSAVKQIFDSKGVVTIVGVAVGLAVLIIVFRD